MRRAAERAGLPVLRIATLTGLLAACSAHGEPQPKAPRIPETDVAEREPGHASWPRFAELSSWPPLNTSPFLVRGHLTQPAFATVRINEGAREAYLTLVTDTAFPDGTLVALFHDSEDGSRKGQRYVAEKKAGKWRFLELDAGGLVVSDDAAACRSCHAEAVADQLFGLPRRESPAR